MDNQTNPPATAEPDGPKQGLQSEIARLRRLIHQAAQAAERAAGQEPPDLDDLVRVLNAVSSASTRLAALIKTQRTLQPDESDQLLAALQRALEQFQNEPSD
ncbi:MAG: hypothetical protein ACK2UW_08980 [Anaerolineales bacterium]